MADFTLWTFVTALGFCVLVFFVIFLFVRPLLTARLPTAPSVLVRLLRSMIWPIFFIVVALILYVTASGFGGGSTWESWLLERGSILTVLGLGVWLIWNLSDWAGTILVQAATKSVSFVDDILYRAIIRLIKIGVLGAGSGVAAILIPLASPWPSKLTASVIIAGLGWIAYECVLDIEKFFSGDPSINPSKIGMEHRTTVTRVRIFKQVALILIGILTLASLLMMFDQVRALGGSLLASAGLAGLILGVAAQKTFGSITTGIQIALTEPIRIGDQVKVGGELGIVEEITLTFVVLRLWDLRRLIIPINKLIEEPFENWTRQTTDLTGTIYLRLDYSLPMDIFREKAGEIVKGNPLWDGKTFAVQITDADEIGLKVRVIASARNSGDLWNLSCEVREKLLSFILNHYPDALPKGRNDQKAVPDWNTGVFIAPSR